MISKLSIQENVSREYWLNKFKTISKNEFPFFIDGENSFQETALILNGSAIRKISELGKGNEVSQYIIYLTLYNIVLSAYVGRTSNVIASPFLKSKNSGSEAGLLFYELSFGTQDLLKDIVKATKEEARKVFNYSEFQYFEFQKIATKIYPEIDLANFFGFSYSPLDNINETYSQLPLQLNIIKTDDRIELLLKYKSSVFDPFIGNRFLAQFKSQVEKFSENITKRGNQIEILCQEDKDILLNDFNNKSIEIRGVDKETIIDFFIQQVIKTPSNTALIVGNKKLTYKDLNEKANRVANYLLEKYRVEKGDVIGVMLSRSENLMVSILGILKAGCTYLPLDPTYPASRISFMVQDSAIKVLITEAGKVEQLHGDKDIMLIDSVSDLNKYSEKNPSIKIGSEDSVYMIYTSGSTGTPKGVKLYHKGFNNLLLWYNHELELQENDRVLLIAPISFDLAQKNLFVAWMSGAALVLQEGDFTDYRRIIEVIEDERVTVINCAPSAFYPLLDIDFLGNYKRLKSLRNIVLGGEPITTIEFRKWLVSGYYNAVLINSYGPTECTDVVSSYRVGKEELLEATNIPIGKPLINTTLYVLNEDRKLCPVGITGEIYIEGIGVSGQYHNNESLSKEKFIRISEHRQRILYKTGDIGKWDSKGNLHFQGRNDEQIKIRGFRVEVGEIENRAMEYEGIIKTIVVVKEDELKNKILILFYIGTEEIGANDWRIFLSTRLPDYMLPNYFHRLQEFPKTSSGKIDKRKLAEQFQDYKILKAFVAPANEIEKILVKIWEEVLGRENIGVEDNFFELGGHSLKAMQILTRIEKDLNVSIELVDIFQNTCICQLSKVIQSLNYKKFNEIVPVHREDSYELSNSQRRMWILSQLTESSLAYHISNVLEFEGLINKELLERAINFLINRHESLCTFFKEDEEGNPRQFILPGEEIDFSISYEDLSKAENQEEGIAKLSIEEQTSPFDLRQAPLLRTKLVKLSQERHVLFFTMHHIISDGWSMEVLSREVIRVYNVLKQGQEPLLTPLRIQYKDYAVWQNSTLSGESLKSHENYWLNQFEGELPVLDLPTAKPRPAIKTHNGSVVSRHINLSLIDKLKQLCSCEGSTLFMGLLSSINTLLYRYTGQEDIIIGSPIAGREQHELEDQIGLYLNTLALRSRFSGEDSFISLLAKTKQVLLDAYSHQSYPFDMLVEKLKLERDMSRSALFDVMIILQNQWGGKIEGVEGLEDLVVKPLAGDKKTSQFDLSFEFVEDKSGLLLRLNYNTDIYSREWIECLGLHYEQLLKNMLYDSTVKISQIDYLSEKEKHQLLVEFNDTAAEYSRDKTIIDLFEEQVEKTPDNIAVVFENQPLTYRKLNERSNQLAHYLRNNYKVKSDDLIGIMVDRSESMLIAILGIIKSGGAYIPIDPDYPLNRIEYIIENSGCNLLLTNKKYEAKCDSVKLHMIFLEDIRDAIELSPSYNPSKVNTPHSLAYVIYTSGSTGNPKGVEVMHRSIVNFLCSMAKSPGINENDILLAVTTNTFDISVLEFFLPLLNGAIVLLPTKDQIQNPELLQRIIIEENPTVIQATPSFWNMLLNAGWQGNSKLKILCGGEKLNPELGKQLMNKVKSLWNLYGPTETTIWSTINHIQEEKDLYTIGKPIDNTQIYILNNKTNVPVGVVGDIYIGGEGLAKGYLHNEELTSEKFILNPYGNNLIYNTGDLGRWLSDGNIEFLGRKDNQVKIRGFRIELGEIESALLQHAKIKEAVVLAKEDTKFSSKYLVAYLVSEELDIEDLRKHLSQGLPEYMLPSYFVQLDKLPLTTNGKIDRKALPAPGEDVNLLGKEYVPPRNETEKKLALIWENVLERSKIGIKDNFFTIGGNSLKAINIISQLRKALEIEAQISDIFNYPTIELFLNALHGLSKENLTQIQSDLISFNSDVATNPQRRLYFLQKKDLTSVAYNMPLFFEVGQLDLLRFKKSIEKTVNEHEILRTQFEMSEYYLEQIVIQKDKAKVDIEYYTVETQDLKDQVLDSFVRPFDLNNYPLYRIGIVTSKTNEFIILFDFHHILVDLISVQLIFEDILRDYFSQKLMQQTFPYKEISNQVFNVNNEKSKAFWKNYFNGFVKNSGLPLDFERSAQNEFKGEEYQFTVGEGTIEKIKHLSLSINSSIFSCFITCISIWINKLTNSEEISIGIPVSGRHNIPDIRVAGLFVNSIPIRIKINSDTSIIEHLKAVRENILNVIENQDLQFDELIDVISYERDTNRNPIFDIMVSYDDLSVSTFRSINHTDIKVISSKNKTSILDLSVTLKDKENFWDIIFEYNSSLFRHETIVSYSQSLLVILEEIAGKVSDKIGDFKIHQKEKKIENKVTKTQDKFKNNIYINGIFNKDELYKLWSKYSKAENINEQDDFFALGGDSLKALLLINQINKQYGITIQLRDFFEDSTLEGLSKIIYLNLSSNQDNKYEFSIIRPLKVKGNNRVLFFVHDVSGDVNSYYPLAENLGNEYDVYGLSYIAKISNVYPETLLVEDLANVYVKEILSIIKFENELYIGGWSAGATIAIEIVRQLEMRSIKVSKLIVIDGEISEAPKLRIFDKESELLLVRKFLGLNLRQEDPKIEYMNEREVWMYFVNKLKFDKELFDSVKIRIASYYKVFPYLELESDPIHLFTKINTIRSINYSVDNYRCNTKILTPTCIIKANQSHLNINLDSWKKVIDQELDIFEIDGDHFSIIKDRYIANLLKKKNKLTKQ